MKRLNRYLLTHHPLLWNMRLHWVVPVLLLLHLLFYLAGLAEPVRLTRLNYSTTNFQAAATSLAVLIGLLTVIGWLAFYLRNNAFKSFYPVRNRQLFLEFLLSLLVIGLASTLSLSHQAGRYQRLGALTQDINVVREANTVSLAFHFLPFEGSRFENYNSCDSQRARASEAAIGINNAPPQDRVAMEAIDSTVERSYLHYCATPALQFYIPEALDQYGVDAIAKRWLFGGMRDSVENMLAAYIALVKKYGGAAEFNIPRHVASIFATPRFLVGNAIAHHYATSDGNSDFIQNYISTQHADDALRAVMDVRRGVLSSELVLFYLYWILGATLLLFTFRVTRLRTWFGAGVGAGIWLAIFAVFAAITQREDGPTLSFLAVAIASIIYAAVNTKQRRRKASSGFAFLWGAWSLMIIVPVLTFYIRSFFWRSEYRYDAAGNIVQYNISPVAVWIDANAETIGFLNLALVVLLAAVYIIPQARKWQAAPEE